MKTTTYIVCLLLAVILSSCASKSTLKNTYALSTIKPGISNTNNSNESDEQYADDSDENLSNENYDYHNRYLTQDPYYEKEMSKYYVQLEMNEYQIREFERSDREYLEIMRIQNEGQAMDDRSLWKFRDRNLKRLLSRKQYQDLIKIRGESY